MDRDKETNSQGSSNIDRGKETRFRMFEEGCATWDMLGIQTTAARSAKVDKTGDQQQ